MEAEMFGWREVILLLVGAATLYLLGAVIRLLRVGKQRTEPGKQKPPLVEIAAPEPVPPPELTEAVAPLSVSRSTEWNDVVDLELLAGPASVPKSGVGVSAPVSGFGEQLAEHLARSDLERQLRQLRLEVDQLRAELDELRTVRNISPHYAEALALAQRGLTAQDVADRMGISLAEAELVHALSRGESLFQEGELDGRDREDGEPADAGDSGIGRYEPDIGFEPRRNG